jgi:hypothetical protein
MMLKPAILPRRAQGKHRKSTPKKASVFSAAGGNYEMFAGRDATLNLGRNSLEADLPGAEKGSVESLTIEERCALEGM